MRMHSRGHGQRLLAGLRIPGWLLSGTAAFVAFLGGVSAPVVPARATVQLTGWSVDSGSSSTASTTPLTPFGASNPPSIYVEPTPTPDTVSDSVGATAGAFRVDEGGASTYSVPVYVPPGTVGFSPVLSLEYHSRGGNGPLGPSWNVGGLSAISRCRKASEFGDGAGPFPPINFDADTTNDAYCLDGARLLALASAANCPSAPNSTAAAFGLETNPATRICAYTQAGITGPAFWLVQPKDGTSRRYGFSGNSALARNNGTGTADATQLLTWALDRIADASSNVIEFSYNRDNANGELSISEVDYTGKVVAGTALTATSYTRAPYNKVQFAYVSMPTASQRVDYLSGMKLQLTQQLTTVTVTGTANHLPDVDAAQIVRVYHLNYSTATASALSAMASIKECVPNGANPEVCYPSTTFNWNYTTGTAKGFPTTPTSASYGNALGHAVDFKVGDIGGDGRQDLVWIKDGQCDSSGSGSTRFQIMVSSSTGTGFGSAVATGIYLNRPAAIGQGSLPGCDGDFSANHFETGWFLYDFTGDGRDDLLALNSAGTAWLIYPAIANAGGGWKFDSANSTNTGVTATPYDDGRLVDLNADALPDLLHGTDGGVIGARFLHRAASTTVAYAFDATDTQVDFATPTPAPTGYPQLNGITFAPTRQGVPPAGDLDGDGAADLVAKVTFSSQLTADCVSPGGPAPGQVRYLSSLITDAIPAAPLCTRYWYTYRNQGVLGDGHLHFAVDDNIGQIGGTAGQLSTNGGDIQLADLNGDGQADLLYQKINTDITKRDVVYRLNGGKADNGATGSRLLAEQSTGVTLTAALASRVQQLDVNGDHRTDLLYAIDAGSGVSPRYPIKARLFGVAGFGSEIAVGNTTSNAQNPTAVQTFLVDVGGDGLADLVRFDSGTLSVATNALLHGGADLVTGITNGLGAVDAVTYAPLPYSSVYDRAFDGPSKVWGRGAPVFDAFANLWVVRSAFQSAPTASAPTAQSFMQYRYSGARMQTGGRGFLGFRSISAEDLQNGIVTTTEYRQDFPFVGVPLHTTVEKESEPLPDPCLANPNGAGCFVDPPDGCGPTGCPIQNVVASRTTVLISDALNTWVTTPAFAPGTVQPVFPYISASNEQKFDLTTGTFSHGVLSSFAMDVNGNLTSSSVASSHGDSSGSSITDETKTVNNVYGCTVSPPPISCSGGNLSTESQRLGRLSISKVQSFRTNQTTVMRRSTFEYDATTRLLIAEIQGPYDSSEATTEQQKRWGLRTDYVLDADGNRTQEVMCSTFHFASRSACLNLANFQQKQWPDDLTKIQRYAKHEYEPKGRFLLKTLAPYSAGASGGTLEDVAEYVGVAGPPPPSQGGPSLLSMLSPSNVNVVVHRSAFGDPLDRIDSAGTGAFFTYGMLGRAYFASGSFGDFSRTTYRWCQDVTNAEVSAANRVNCPAGAVFRVATESVASAGQTGAGGIGAGASVTPTTYSYFDVLGREVLKTTRIYQQDSQSPNRWSSVATTYDSTGRIKTATVPYFSANADGPQATARAGAALIGTPAIAQTDYDAVNRATTLTIPETPTNGVSTSTLSYSQLDIDATNARGYHSKQTKNGRAEATKAVDDAALTVTYGRDAVGNLTSVSRTPTDGDSAGLQIQSTMQYDRLGRRTTITDPDKGTWLYDYNAFGEVIEQTDAKGQKQTLYHDALGRLIQRTETRAAGGGTFTSEASSSWEYDTDLRDGSLNPDITNTPVLGRLHIESNGLGGFSRSTHYNDGGRLSSVVTTVDGTSYTEVQTFDAVGRPFQHFAPSTANSADGEMSEYSTDGYPIRTRDSNNGTNGQLYNEILVMTQRGQVRQEKFHNAAALTTTRTYDDNTGRMLTLSSGSALQLWDYTYDKHANMKSRRNHATGFDLTEAFEYDTLDRLQKITPSGGGAVLNVTYDQLGNLKSKSNGTTTYTWTYAGGGGAGCARANAGRHAVSSMGGATFCYDENGNQVTATYVGGSKRQITYTGYDLPETITTNGYPSSTTQSYKYAPDREMWKRVDGAVPSVAPNCPDASDRLFCDGFEQRVGGSPGASTYFVGNIEVRASGSTTTTKRYVGSYLVITTTNTNSTPQYDYLFRDALGSLDVIASETGAVRQRMSFDAWGQRRAVQPGSTDYFSWLLSPASAATFDTSSTYEGFTGHQQLDPVGLVHMRGRLYDPALGRFIQADPYTEREVTQGLNRYSYVLNNPLSLTDPTGFLSFRQWVGLAIAIAASYISGQYWIAENYWASFCVAVAGGFASAYVATGSLRAGLWGAFSAGVFWGIGSAFSQSWAYDNGISCTAEMTQGAQWAKVAAHGAAGGVLTELQGGSFGSGFIAAGATQAVSPAIEGMPVSAQFVANVAVGGTISQATGGSFANGAETAAFQFLFNQAVHPPAVHKLTHADDASIPVGGFSDINDAITYVGKEVFAASNASPGKWEYGGAVIEMQGMFFPTNVVSSGKPGVFQFSYAPMKGETVAALVHMHPAGGTGGMPNILDAHDVNTADALAKGSFAYKPHQANGFSTYIVQPGTGGMLGYTPGVTPTVGAFAADSIHQRGSAIPFQFCEGCAK